MGQVDIVHIAVLLGGLGFICAVASLLTSIEVSKRTQVFLAKHVRKMDRTMSLRIDEQDRYLKQSLEKFRIKLEELEDRQDARAADITDMKTQLEELVEAAEKQKERQAKKRARDSMTFPSSS